MRQQTRPTAIVVAAGLAAASCSPREPEPVPKRQAAAPTRTDAPDRPEPAAATRREGRIELGGECRVLHTPDGKRYALGGNVPFDTGKYVRVEGTISEAGFCMEGDGTIEVARISLADPPARDRDPARAGGLAVTGDYVRGEWVAKGADADCGHPDFAIAPNANGMNIIKARVSGTPQTGAVDVGASPALQWDDPLPALPIETRGPDGLAVMPPTGNAKVTLAGHPVEGDGIVFVRCA
ncbi:hypothetical protein B2G71_07045 [Novosphingobium sp. PC22D]|uniref:DUF5818 domain-containing protein n=1 Tax=Novosphingobium sp. PC22D TaxID=1962403 RepID=UPI000BF0B79A|nr:DUF5818 domain-containing protein [Novosphingobium sp. PC22D]PEQ13193.1 hypothetical protein B2G71_07045 [Novosphingobium sp. PC22D]